MVRAGFAHRRKMLRRSLDGTRGPGGLRGRRHRPTARAEELSLDEWERLAAWQPSRDPIGEPGPVTGGPAAPVEVSRAGQADPLAAGHRVRSDGYHLLESEMVTLDLADTLVIDDGSGDGGSPI